VSSLVGLPEGLVQVYEIDINNAGQVSVMAIPEPQSYMMLLGGLDLTGFIVRRKRLLV
jgi:hypothetical protein